MRTRERVVRVTQRLAFSAIEDIRLIAKFCGEEIPDYFAAVDIGSSLADDRRWKVL
jgi:hypothetical protein